MNGSNTIEPHLIALLNDAPAVFITSPTRDLPPLQAPQIVKTLGQSLPIEQDTRKLNRATEVCPKSSSGQVSVIPPIDDEKGSIQNHERSSSNRSKINELPVSNSSRQSLSKILDNEQSNVLHPSKKRKQKDSNKDDFVQLPQPPKKHKTAKQVVPPIIIGLFDPPTQSTLFPPIASSSFHDSHGRNSLNPIPLKTGLSSEALDSKAESSTGKTTARNGKVRKSKSVAARKKWTEEETNSLLLGVHKHGVGCWADILSDPIFVFNGRSSSDLKDRWRTCCPNELRKKISSGIEEKTKGTTVKSRSSLNLDKIIVQDESCHILSDQKEIDSPLQQKKRSHRKKLEDLFKLGIEGPIRQSSRRERRQFTEEEDRAILDGYKIYGPAWSKIQKDPRLNLQSRQPTDLRDRFRNKFPEKFREDKENKISFVFKKTDQPTEEIASLPQKDTSKKIDKTVIKENSNMSTQLVLRSIPNRDGLRIQEIVSSEPFHTLVDQTAIDSVENLSFCQFSDWNQSNTSSFPSINGEMDISRLLLDETWSDIPHGKEKKTSPEANNLLAVGSERSHQLPSCFNLSNDTDELVEESFG
ncbi:MYB DNA-binding domain containing protein [Golovinomyces cichoracearum]|uniref:MYB DNA-binding domain containing protein n=1 Tax=Golovinomyces cichoracearum TaxID=62708 RepID=A0A420J9M4_9PEZI|nr:MYB DNA-binding domain containing protein [Golovinomyces cichoracearum]